MSKCTTEEKLYTLNRQLGVPYRTSSRYALVQRNAARMQWFLYNPFNQDKNQRDIFISGLIGLLTGNEIAELAEPINEEWLITEAIAQGLIPDDGKFEVSEMTQLLGLFKKHSQSALISSFLDQLGEARKYCSNWRAWADEEKSLIKLKCCPFMEDALRMDYCDRLIGYLTPEEVLPLRSAITPDDLRALS